jgi:hypothetical protein
VTDLPSSDSQLKWFMEDREPPVVAPSARQHFLSRRDHRFIVVTVTWLA